MKKTTIVLLLVFSILLSFRLLANDLTVLNVKVRFFAAPKPAEAAQASVVTSYYLKNFFSGSMVGEFEQSKQMAELRRIFNLADLRLLSEGNLVCDTSSGKSAFQVVRLNNNEYLIELTPQMQGEDIRFRVAISARTEQQESRSLLDSELTMPLDKVAVFGFRDEKENAYFLSFFVEGLVTGTQKADEVILTIGKDLSLTINHQEPLPFAALENRLREIFKGRQDKALVIHADKAIAYKDVLGVIDAVKAAGVQVMDVVTRLTAEQRPKLIKQVKPIYPEIALQAAIQGIVIVEVATDIYGRVQQARVITGHPLLNDAAVTAVKQWIYEPLMISGVPKPALFTVTVTFVMAGEEGKSAGASLMKGEEEGIRRVAANQRPKLIKQVKPIYPEIAALAAIQGNVVIEAVTDIYGRVQQTRVISGHPLLNDAAVNAVKQWIYEPCIENGKPVPVVFAVTVTFRLGQDQMKSGVASGVKGGLEGGVQGGVAGGVEGGVSGGVEGGVAGNKEAAVPSIWPVRKGYVSLGFTNFINPFTGKSEFHAAVDIAAATGTKVMAAADGTVVGAETLPRYGNVVVIDHGYGYQTRYARLDKILVKMKQKVKRFDVIGTVGNTGTSSTGPHLHYEVRYFDKPVDPVKFIK